MVRSIRMRAPIRSLALAALLLSSFPLFPGGSRAEPQGGALPRPQRHVLPNGVRVEPTVDLFNVFNNNAVTNAVTAVGSSLGRPSAIVMGRLLRVGGHVTF